MANSPSRAPLIVAFVLSLLWSFASVWLALIRLLMGDFAIAAAILVSGMLVLGLGMFALVRAGGDD